MELEKPFNIEQRDKQALAAGYNWKIRTFEIVSIIAFLSTTAFLAVRIAPANFHAPWLSLTLMLIGYLAADFLTGMFHWAADTWGTVEWPIVGQGLIRPFREHHIDQKEITRHDFIETNGASCFIAFFFVFGASFLSQGPGKTWQLVAASLAFWTMLIGFLTNQFHKWAHEDAPPAWVAALQRWRVILPRGHHQIHHMAPFTKYYCITHGWLNEPLHRIGYYRVLEKWISAVTGLVPREDDLGKKAAQALSGDALAQAESGPAAIAAQPVPTQTGR